MMNSYWASYFKRGIIPLSASPIHFIHRSLFSISIFQNCRPVVSSIPFRLEWFDSTLAATPDLKLNGNDSSIIVSNRLNRQTLF